MKTLLITFIFCLFDLNSTEIIGKYQIENGHSFDTLELKKDGTYKYQSRGRSCWTWSDISGNWELINDTLILHHNYSYTEDAIEYIEKTNTNSGDHVIIQVKDSFNNPINDFEVNYSYINLKNKQTNKTDKNGVIRFKKYKVIYNENETARIDIKYIENGTEISESRVIKRNSDRIIISINRTPKTIYKKERYLFQFIEGKLKSIEFPYVDEISTYKKL